MSSIDNKFSSIWYDTTTPPGSPLLGLLATIRIRRKDTNVLVVNNEAMTEVGLGEYDYDYIGMEEGVSYSYVMNPNSALAFIDSGFANPIPVSGGGGGGFIDLTAKNEEVLKAFKEFKEILEDNKPDLSEVKKAIKAIKIPEGKMDISPIMSSMSKFLTNIEGKIESVKSEDYETIRDAITTQIEQMSREVEEKTRENETMKSLVIAKDNRIEELKGECEEEKENVKSLQDIIESMEDDEKEEKKTEAVKTKRTQILEEALKSLSE